MTNQAQNNQEVNNLKANAKGLEAQLDAAKQMTNDGQQVIFQLRTNLNLFQVANQELQQKNQELQTENSRLQAKVEELTPEINEVEHDYCEAKESELVPIKRKKA